MKLISALMLIQSMLSLERKNNCTGDDCEEEEKRRLHRKVTFLRKTGKKCDPAIDDNCEEKRRLHRKVTFLR